MEITCCLDCKDRYVGCHSECKRYENYKKINKELKEKHYKRYILTYSSRDIRKK